MGDRSDSNKFAELHRLAGILSAAEASGDAVKERSTIMDIITYATRQSAFLDRYPNVKTYIKTIADGLKDKYGGEVPKEVTEFLRVISPQTGGAKRKRTRRQKLKHARRTRR